jgi:hypothetical protein
MNRLNDMVSDIRKLGGEVFAVTAQVDDSSESDWNLRYDVHIDSHCTLARIFQLAITERNGYPYGMSQPGLVVLQKQQNVQGSYPSIQNLETSKLLYHWAVEPSKMNMGGGSDRPILDDVLEVVELKLKGNEQAAANKKVGSTGKSISLKTAVIYFKPITWKYLIGVHCCCCCYGNTEVEED